jgi:ABC-type multidrug transport system ATPase subunit
MESTVNSSEEIVLCPTCRAPRQVDGKCPVCGEKVEPGDWPSIPFAEELSPCSPQNLLPPADGHREYQMSPCAATVAVGELCTRFPYEFPFGKLVVRIGGSSQKADVLIKGASPLHAVLIQNKRTRHWWIYDCGSYSGTSVNGERVHCQELQTHDIITVAGVALVFRGNRLESGTVSDKGISLFVKHLCSATSERQILDDVTFSASPGEFIGILGPSGCGKSSLVQAIAGLVKPKAGEIEVSGEVYANGHPRDSVLGEFRAATAYLPQNVELTLHDALTVKDELACFRRIHLPPSEKEKEEQEDAKLLADLGLLDKDNKPILNARIGKLSGGQKRRVGIALALLRRSRLLLLDEPGAGLDPASESLVMKYFRGVANQGATVLCVTHVLANLGDFDKVLVLSKKGKIVYSGNPTELLSAFEVANFGMLYEQLEKGAVRSLYESPEDDRTTSDLPAVDEPSCLQRSHGYFMRMVRDFFSPLVTFFSSGRRDGKFLSALLGGVRSVPAVLFVWQPLLLVIGIRLACAIGFRNCYEDLDLLGFCASLAMFWVGINNAARELVKERVPGRCLENLNHVPCSAYLLSKLFWTLFVCALQALSFTLMLKAAASFEMPLVAENQTSGFGMSVWWFFPLYVSCLVGAFLGLAISATNKKMMSAISVVPNIAIFALLFSNVMIRFETEKYYVSLAKEVACCTPCYWASKVLEDIQNGVQYGFYATQELLAENDYKGVLQGVFGNNLCHLLQVFAVSAALSAVIVWVFQRRNESAWNGRQ